MAYTIPTAADLIALYPAFADVAEATITAHITRASTQAVDTSWAEVDYAPAITDYAAHTMALAGLGVQDETDRYARKGVTGIRTGNFSAQFSDKRVAKASGGGLDATSYGQEYKKALYRNKRGARVIPGRAACDDGWGPTGRTVDGTVLPWGC